MVAWVALTMRKSLHPDPSVSLQTVSLWCNHGVNPSFLIGDRCLASSSATAIVFFLPHTCWIVYIPRNLLGTSGMRSQISVTYPPTSSITPWTELVLMPSESSCWSGICSACENIRQILTVRSDAFACCQLSSARLRLTELSLEGAVCFRLLCIVLLRIGSRELHPSAEYDFLEMSDRTDGTEEKKTEFAFSASAGK